MSSKKKNKQSRVAFVALGCPKNTIDSEKMLADIVTNDFILTDSIDYADIVVINTCGFIEAARREAFGEIDNAVRLKKQGRIKKIIVAGCMAQLYGGEIFKSAGDVDAVVGLSGRDKLVEVIKEVQTAQSGQLHLGGSDDKVHFDGGRLLITPGHYAYLRISEGCSRRCAFCTIPDIRGPFRSKPMDMIITEAKQLADSGVKELILIAQDTSNYGSDLKIENGLVKVLDELEKIDGFRWIRIMYLYPANVTDELVGKIAASEKIVKYVDMPIQHINDDILKAMKRSDTNAKTAGLIGKLRGAVPGIVLRTTVIAGFPGETEQQFRQLVDFIKATRFDMLGCFAYSAEKGTKAAQLQGQIPEHIKQQRLREVMTVQQQIAFDRAKDMVGETAEVIVDQLGDEGFGTGRYYGQAPEIDSVCLIENLNARPGDIIRAKVIGTDEYDLVVRQIK